MLRRQFLKLTGLTAGAVTLSSCAGAGTGKPEHLLKSGSLSVDGVHIRYHLPQIREAVKIFKVTDTHLWRDDQRGEPYRKYSERMARAYNRTSHFQTGEPTNPEESFEQVLRMAVEKGADLLALTGDTLSFPSEAAVEWLMERLEASGLNWIYTSGNHDWHYEGMEGSLEELRQTWIENRLLPLYRGSNPMFDRFTVKGIRVLSIDSSTYQISNEQLAFFREQAADGEPVLLMTHIPFFAPGRSIWSGVGHPDWNEDSDPAYELEGRDPWPREGHTETTFRYREEVFSAPGLLGVFAGHRHRYLMDLVKGVPQFVAPPNANGGYLEIDLLPG